MKFRSWALAIVCALTLSFAQATPASAADWSEPEPWLNAAEIGFDVGVLRPLNFAAVVVGAGFFAVTAPFVLPFGDLSTPFEIFVFAPVEYTFLRDLGDF